MRSERSPKQIGLAIVGAGRIGLIRGEIAAKHPNVGWIGVAEIRADRAKEVAERIGADFVTTDYRELLARPEATAAVIATDENRGSLLMYDRTSGSQSVAMTEPKRQQRMTSAMLSLSR